MKACTGLTLAAADLLIEVRIHTARDEFFAFQTTGRQSGKFYKLWTEMLNDAFEIKEKVR